MSESTGYASRDQLIGVSAAVRFRDETLPVSGLKLRLRSLNELEWETFQKSLTSKKTGTVSSERAAAVRRRLVVLCAVGGDGNRLLTDADLHHLLTWDSADIQHVNEALANHLGLTDDDIETLAKNSGPITADSSPSA